MSIVKINAITVPGDSGDELAHRFAARASAMEGVEGFLGFELLRPTDGRHTWLVVTRWRDDVAYEAWVGSDSFAAGHGRPAQRDHGDRAGTPGADGHAAPDGGRRRPVGLAAELWSFDIAGGSGID